jgi:nicotinamidase-related amidase
MPALPSPVPDDTMLLCVDMQPVFLKAIPGADRITRRCEFAISAALGVGVAVAFTEQVPMKLGGTTPELIALALRAPVWGKNTFSALADDGIRDDLLRRRDIQHLILCGIETAVCVYQTALTAIADGVQVTVLADAIGGRRPEDGHVCLAELARLGVHILPAETVFYAMLRDVGHPYFRAYTQLVKLHSDS